MTLEQTLSQLVKAAVKSLYDIEAADAQIQLQKTRPEFEGNITLVVFPFVKLARKAPAQVAAEIGEWILASGGSPVAKYNAVQGFLNLSISDAFWVEQLKAIADVGIRQEFVRRKVDLLEYARKKTTQKVNLFEKVQIPGYQDAIRKIKRFMEDEENLNKSSQKIVKSKREKEAREKEGGNA